MSLFISRGFKGTACISVLLLSSTITCSPSEALAQDFCTNFIEIVENTSDFYQVMAEPIDEDSWAAKIHLNGSICQIDKDGDNDLWYKCEFLRTEILENSEKAFRLLTEKIEGCLGSDWSLIAEYSSEESTDLMYSNYKIDSAFMVERRNRLDIKLVDGEVVAPTIWYVEVNVLPK